MVGGGLTGTLLGPLDYMFGETLRVAIVVAVLLAAAFAVLARFRAWSFERAARNWLLVTSLAAIYLFTQHSPYAGHGHILDLSPFSDVKAARYSDHRRDLVLANIALFFPFGAALAWRRIRFSRALLCALTLSVVAETLQYVAGHGRIAQIDDVVFNTGGAMIGWIVAAIGVWVLEGQRRVASQIQRRTGQDAGQHSDQHGDTERYRDRAGRA
jgi:glycopeptide antibiotics resistance protein